MSGIRYNELNIKRLQKWGDWKMAVTINDVAKRAGVSIATVSRVLNGAENVGPLLYQKVNAAINDLGYVPNFTAQSLKQSSSKLIGITASDLSVAFFPEVVKCVEKRFLPKGYATIVSSTYDDPENEKTILQHMFARRPDALLINSTGQNEQTLEQILASGTPVIFYDRPPRNKNFPSVYADKNKSMYIAAEYLTSLGHRKIRLITGPRMLSSNYERYMGIQRFIFDKNLDPADFSFTFGEFSYSNGYATTEAIFQMDVQERPTAIITGSIAITAGILAYCEEHDIAVPGSLSIISSGNFPYGNVAGIKLTYLDDRSYQLAEITANLLEQCLAGEKIPSNYRMVLEPILHVQDTTGAR